MAGTERQIVGTGGHRYEWVERWAVIPDTESGRKNGRTHGVAVTSAGSVVVFHQANPAVVFYSPDGRIQRSWGDTFGGAHGLTLVHEDQEYLWLTDQDSGAVEKRTLDGDRVLKLDRPPRDEYREGAYSPTWVAVNEERYGGNGDIWVADGYGMSLLHRYASDGRYQRSLTGPAEDDRFSCPHGIGFDYRGGMTELIIADRGNRRMLVMSPDGTFVRSATDHLSLPCGSIVAGELLVVPQLDARVTLFDGSGRFICDLGENSAACAIEGWPDHPARMIVPGKFNSPHAVSADADGNLFIVEWIIGGRITKLKRLQA